MPLRILVLSLPFTFTGMILSWTLIARGLQHRLIPIVAASLTLNLVLNLALVPTYSYKASAGVTLATEALGAFALVYFVRRWLGVSPSLVSVVKIVASGGVALAAGLLCAHVQRDPRHRWSRSRSSPASCSRSGWSRATRSTRSSAGGRRPRALGARLAAGASARRGA